MIQKVSFVKKRLEKKGFTLLEVVIGIALISIVLLGLAQLFTLSVMNNLRSSNITNASFLAQQKIDLLRNWTASELGSAISAPMDEHIDTNNDGTYDFRRITRVNSQGYYWNIKVLVFSAAQMAVDVNDLIANPGSNELKAQMSTLISR